MMKNSDDFYIGWKDDMPKSTKSFLKKWIVGLLLLVLVLLISVVLLQKPFNDHHFELGKISDVTGTYYNSPLPMLVADEGSLPDGLSRSILLVGYGKFGAEGIMRKIEKANGSLSGRKLILRGTLIYGDGKTLMELTEKENSFVKLLGGPTKSSPARKERSRKTLQGEILDPKCYFGVMKPGEGKVHKSCATRCISGGIPPVLRALTMDKSNPYQYYIVLDEQGKKTNKSILPFVAEQVRMNGITNNFEGWDIIYVNMKEIKFVE